MTRPIAAERAAADRAATEQGAAAFLPARRTLPALRAAAATCRGCDLWEHATQTVFGSGSVPAPLMLVGEQPGDREDLAGEPFVGPAGQILNTALREAGIDRERVFVTNVVKHFKWRPSGKRRLHERPNRAEVRACRPWLEAELDLVRPELLVLMGATAAQAILGPTFRVSTEHGRIVPSPLAVRVMTTVHPSSILRADPDARQRELELLIADLAAAGRAAKLVA
jgi:uracil-DNA glycosylase family protein